MAIPIGLELLAIRVRAPSQDFYNKISAVNDQVVWVLGYNNPTNLASAQFECIVTRDGGASWKHTLNPSFPYSLLFQSGFDAVDASTAWFGSRMQVSGAVNAIMAKTTDGGSNWVIQDNSTQGSYSGVSAVDSNTAWGVTTAWLITSTTTVPGTIKHTTNGGWSSTPPVITSVTPAPAKPNGEITIAGSNFGTSKGSSKVYVADQEATISSWSDPQIKCIVPSSTPSGAVQLEVITSTGVATTTLNIIVALSITSIDPNQAMQYALFVSLVVNCQGFEPGATVSLENGSNFIDASGADVAGQTSINCSLLLFGQEPGAYDVVVKNPEAI
jgi:IPT/TIG domain